MIYLASVLQVIMFISLLAPTPPTWSQKPELVTYAGVLKVGRYESTINYLGEETGDLAAFCFKTKSAVGRAIFSKCKDGDQCKFTGYLRWEDCRVGGAVSATGRMFR
jgi:hypothetical protein